MLHRPHTNPIELFFKRTCVIEVIDLMTTMLTRLILPFIRLIILHIHLLLFSHKHNSLPISFHFFEPHNEYTHIISKHHPIYVCIMRIKKIDFFLLSRRDRRCWKLTWRCRVRATGRERTLCRMRISFNTKIENAKKLQRKKSKKRVICDQCDRQKGLKNKKIFCLH